MIRRELAGLIWFEAQVIRERSQVAWLAFDRAEVVNSLVSLNLLIALSKIQVQ